MRDASDPGSELETRVEWDPYGRAQGGLYLHTVMLPRMRLLGFAALAGLIAAYDLVALGGLLTGGDYARLLTLLGAYNAASWWLVRRLDGRARSVDLTFAFMNADVAVILGALLIVGPEHGLLPIVLLARVGDHVSISAARAYYFTHLVTLGYGALLLWFAYGQGAVVDWPLGLGILLVLYVVGSYISFTARTADLLHARVRRAVHRAKALIAERDRQREQLEHQIFQLESAREQLQYFEDLYLLSPVAIVSLDNDHRVVTCNPAFEELFGYSLEEVVSERLFDLIGLDEQKEEMKSALEQAQAGRLHTTTRRRRKDGSMVDVEILAVPVIVHDKRVGLLGLYHDISEQLEAREAAEAASRAKSEFVANMSHEIRTPMNGIIGMTELALDTELTDEQREYLGMVRESANALLTLINELLDFSKIESGRLEVNEMAFELRQTLQSAVDAIGIAAADKGVELSVEVAPGVPRRLVSDPHRLRQLVVNLVGNAIKFTEEGAVRVTVELLEMAAPECRLRLEVSDTGIGIPVDQQHRVFDAFVQVDGSSTREYGGTGLGLAICKQIATLLDGRLELESNPGVGTTVRLDFTAQLAPSRPAVDRRSGRSLHGTRALVVDDNPTTRMVLEQTARGWGMEVDTAKEGLEALEMAQSAVHREQPYELFLLDYQMPAMDGFVVAETLRTLRVQGRDPVVVLLTSDGRPGDAARCRDLGIDAYLTKPVGRQELYDAVYSALGQVADDRIDRLVTRHSLREDRQPLRVLVAEDNAVNQRLAARLLEKWGYMVDVVETGAEALERVKRGGIDAVLMDVQMPKMNGLEATRSIRDWEQEANGSRTPIIGVTAHAMASDRLACIGAGMDYFLPKPLQADVLRRTLEMISSDSPRQIDKPLGRAAPD